MARLLLGIAFLILPLFEIALLIKAGRAIGLWPTLGLVIAAALLGAAIMSRQGITVARKTQEAIAHGRPPVGPVLDGALLLVAGALLISPGFLTDILALPLLFPALRRKIARWGMRRAAERAHVQLKVHESRQPDASAPPGKGMRDGPVIEGDFKRLDEQTLTVHPDSDKDRL
jgi:UPF0716 protein FxsA